MYHPSIYLYFIFYIRSRHFVVCCLDVGLCANLMFYNRNLLISLVTMCFFLQSYVAIIYKYELAGLYSQVDLKDQHTLVSMLAPRNN
jgi:hypothetical protein